MAAIDDLLANNQRYAAAFTRGGLPAPPALRLAIVTCMDARINVYAIFGLREGDAHVIRNAGGVVTDDVIRSLLISQRLLGTREVVVLHHTGCGMLTVREEDLKTQIEMEVGIRPPFALEAFRDLEGDVRQSVARIKASAFIPYKDQVRGFVYDVESGQVREVRV